MSKLKLKFFTSSALLVDGLLSVVHITEDGTSFLKPLKITDTHVVVDVPHFSILGVVYDLIKGLLNIPREIKSEVQLFLRYPDLEPEVLDVLLLPHNVVLNEVRPKVRPAEVQPVEFSLLLPLLEVFKFSV